MKGPVLLILLSILIFYSCEDDDSNYENDYGPIESNIHFTFVSDPTIGFEPTGSINLYLKTEMAYPCFNYEIVYDKKIQTDRIDIDLEGIVLPGGICATAIGPARVKILLGIMTGEFNINFTYESLTDNHHVLISDTSIVVTPVDTSFTHYLEYSSGEWW